MSGSLVSYPVEDQYGEVEKDFGMSVCVCVPEGRETDAANQVRSSVSLNQGHGNVSMPESEQTMIRVWKAGEAGGGQVCQERNSGFVFEYVEPQICIVQGS